MKEANKDSPVILVSGGDGGIGTVIVKELIEHGYRVSLGSLHPEALSDLHGPETTERLYTEFDAFDHRSADRWVDKTLEHFGRLDGLVNAIGLGERVTIMDDDEEALDRLWEVNVKAPLRLTRLCLPYLEATGRGRVVNLVSLAGKRIKNSAVGYGITKYALMGVTHATRTYSWDKGVRATAICPGWVRTKMSMTSPTLKIKPEEMIDPETIAHLVRTTIELPNNAAIAEVLVNCEFEDLF